jgi:hypothetical protein
MRLITGFHKASSIDHLLAETKMMWVSEHLGILCAPYLASCLNPMHLSREVVLLPPGPRTNNQGRPLKETLSSKFHDVVSPHTHDGRVILEVRQNRTKNKIHTAAVRASIAAGGLNPVLGHKASEVHPLEESLPRMTLVQLRSGKCSALKSYQHFIHAANDDVCPDCRSVPHTTNNLFNYHALQTSLTVIDLWRNSVKAADFLL